MSGSGLSDLSRELCSRLGSVTPAGGTDEQKAAGVLHAALVHLDEHAAELLKVWQEVEGKGDANADIRLLVFWAAKKIPDLLEEIEGLQNTLRVEYGEEVP